MKPFVQVKLAIADPTCLLSPSIVSVNMAGGETPPAELLYSPGRAARAGVLPGRTQ